MLIVGRDVVLALLLPVMRRHGYGPFEVHYLGKAATFCLLYALPLLLLAQGDSALAQVARPLALGFTGWGVLLYLWAGALYLGRCSGWSATPRWCRRTQRISVRSATGV